MFKYESFKYESKYKCSLIRKSYEYDGFLFIKNEKPRKLTSSDPSSNKTAENHQKTEIDDTIKNYKLSKYGFEFTKTYTDILLRRKCDDIFDPRKFLRHSSVFQFYVLNIIFVCTSESSPLFHIPFEVILHIIIPFIDELEIFEKYNLILGPFQRMRKLKMSPKFQPRLKDYYLGRLNKITKINDTDEFISRMMDITEVLRYFSKSILYNNYTSLNYVLLSHLEEKEKIRFSKPQSKFIIESVIHIIDKILCFEPEKVIRRYFGEELKVKIPSPGGYGSFYRRSQSSAFFFIADWGNLEKASVQVCCNRSILVKLLRNACSIIDSFIYFWEEEIGNDIQEKNFILSLFISKLSPQAQNDKVHIRYFRVFALYLFYCRSCYKKGHGRKSSRFFKHTNFFMRVLHVIQHFHPFQSSKTKTTTTTTMKNITKKAEEIERIRSEIRDEVTVVEDLYHYFFHTLYDNFKNNKSYGLDAVQTNLFRKNSGLMEIITQYYQIIRKRLLSCPIITSEEEEEEGEGEEEEEQEEKKKNHQYFWMKYDFRMIMFLFEIKHELKYFETVCELVKIWRIMIQDSRTDNSEKGLLMKGKETERRNLDNNNEVVSKVWGESDDKRDYVLPGLKHIWEILFNNKRNSEKYESMKDIIIVDLFRHSLAEHILHPKTKPNNGMLMWGHQRQFSYFCEANAKWYLDELETKSPCSYHVLFLPFHPFDSNEASLVHRIMWYFEQLQAVLESPWEILEENGNHNFEVLFRFLSGYKSIIVRFYTRELPFVQKSVVQSKHLDKKIESLRKNLNHDEPQFSIPQKYLDRLSHVIRIANLYSEFTQNFECTKVYGRKKKLSRSKNFKKGIVHYVRKFLNFDLKGVEEKGTNSFFEIYNSLFEFNGVFVSKLVGKEKYMKEQFLVKKKERFEEVCMFVFSEGCKLKIVRKACSNLLGFLFEGEGGGDEEVERMKERILKLEKENVLKKE